MKKLNVINKNEISFFKFEFFLKFIPIKYKAIDFAPSNKQLMTIKLSLNSFERFLRRTKISAYALMARNISHVNCPKLSQIGQNGNL